MFSIEDIVWDSQGTSVSAAVGRTFGQGREPPDWFTRASVGLQIISKRHPFKGTFGFEMYLIR